MRRRAAVAALLTLTLVGAACSDDERDTLELDVEEGRPGPGTGRSPSGSGPETGSGGAGGAPVTAPPPGTPPASPGPGSPPSGDGGDDDGPSGGLGHSRRRGPATTVAPARFDDAAGVGAMAAALLSPEVPEAVVEVDRTEDASLADQALSALGDHLREHGGKSVARAAGEVVAPREVWTLEALRQAAATHRDTRSDGDRVSVYVMVLSGRFEEEDVVGVAFSATAFALFPHQLTGGIVGLNRANYEEAVTVHELGHLFGLVNLTGHGAFHEDPEHRGHSANSGSVMFWAVESTLVGDVFEGGPPRQFDADDREEMQRIRASGGI